MAILVCADGLNLFPDQDLHEPLFLCQCLNPTLNIQKPETDTHNWWKEFNMSATEFVPGQQWAKPAEAISGYVG